MSTPLPLDRPLPPARRAASPRGCRRAWWDRSVLPSTGERRRARRLRRRAGHQRYARHRRLAAVALAGLTAVVAAACGGSDGAGSGSSPSTLPALRLERQDDGVAADLAAYRGRPVVVNVWAPWCAPCRTEMPALQGLQDRQGDRLTVVGITDDPDRDGARAAAARAGVRYPLLVDVDQQLQRALSITGLPATVFLDGQGRIVDRHDGALDTTTLDETVRRVYGLG